ncbi:hypothetical protein MASR1M107_05570 [Ignavibacteriales bacterium]
MAENDIEPQKYTIGDVNIYDLKGINNANVFNAVMSDINPETTRGTTSQTAGTSSRSSCTATTSGYGST